MPGGGLLRGLQPGVAPSAFRYSSDVAVDPDATSLLVAGLKLAALPVSADPVEWCPTFAAGNAYAGSCPLPFPGLYPSARATFLVTDAGPGRCGPGTGPDRCPGRPGLGGVFPVTQSTSRTTALWIPASVGSDACPLAVPAPISDGIMTTASARTPSGAPAEDAFPPVPGTVQWTAPGIPAASAVPNAARYPHAQPRACPLPSKTEEQES